MRLKTKMRLIHLEKEVQWLLTGSYPKIKMSRFKNPKKRHYKTTARKKGYYRLEDGFLTNEKHKNKTSTKLYQNKEIAWQYPTALL